MTILMGSVACSAVSNADEPQKLAPDASRPQSLAETLPRTGSTRHFGIALDHINPDAFPASFQEVVSLAGAVDVLVNNGHKALRAGWSTVTAEEFSRQLGNATGYFVLSKLLRDHAAQRGASASVILLGSMYGVVGSYSDAYEDICAASPVAYHTLKGGIVHMTRHLVAYWAKDRVRVNCLSLGPFPGRRRLQHFLNDWFQNRR